MENDRIAKLLAAANLKRDESESDESYIARLAHATGLTDDASIAFLTIQMRFSREMMAVPSAAEKASDKVAENAAAVMTGRAEKALEKALPTFVAGLSETVAKVAEKQADRDLVLVFCLLTAALFVILSITFGLGFLTGFHASSPTAVFPVWWTGKTEFDFLMRAPAGIVGLWSGFCVSVASLIVRRLPEQRNHARGPVKPGIWHMPSAAGAVIFAGLLAITYIV